MSEFKFILSRPYNTDIKHPCEWRKVAMFGVTGIREAHSLRDWLMLAASVLVFVQFARGFWSRNFEH
jgi:hypothetical protein